MYFLIDAVGRLPAEYFQTNQRGTGDEQYPPRMLQVLLIFCYATLLIVGGYVTDVLTDKQQLVSAIESIPAAVATPENILADTGYRSVCSSPV